MDQQQNNKEKSNTYCQLCKVECCNGFNFSRHIGSKKHMKKMPLTTPPTRVLVYLDIDGEDDEIYFPTPDKKTKLPL